MKMRQRRAYTQAQWTRLKWRRSIRGLLCVGTQPPIQPRIITDQEQFLQLFGEPQR